MHKYSRLVLWMKLFLKDSSSTGKGARKGKGRQMFAPHDGRQQGDMSIFDRSLPPDTMALGVSPAPQSGLSEGRAQGRHVLPMLWGELSSLASLTSMILIE